MLGMRPENPLLSVSGPGDRHQSRPVPLISLRALVIIGLAASAAVLAVFHPASSWA